MQSLLNFFVILAVIGYSCGSLAAFQRLIGSSLFEVRKLRDFVVQEKVMSVSIGLIAGCSRRQSKPVILWDYFALF